MKRSGDRRQRGQHEVGFTLIELMMVVSIIGLLSSVAIPAFSRYIKRARTVEAVEAISKIATGAKVYFQQHDELPRTSKGYAPRLSHNDACEKFAGAFPKHTWVKDFAMEPWPSLMFTPGENPRYRYSWVVNSRSANSRSAKMQRTTDTKAFLYALGDLDCNKRYSQWRLILQEDPKEKAGLVARGPAIVKGTAID